MGREGHASVSPQTQGKDTANNIVFLLPSEIETIILHLFTGSFEVLLKGQIYPRDLFAAIRLVILTSHNILSPAQPAIAIDCHQANHP